MEQVGEKVREWCRQRYMSVLSDAFNAFHSRATRKAKLEGLLLLPFPLID